MAGVPAGGQAADGQLQLVPVRADQADAPVELAGPAPDNALSSAVSRAPISSNSSLFSNAELR